MKNRRHSFISTKLRITCFSQHFLRFFYISAQMFRFMTVAPYCDDLSAKLSVPFEKIKPIVEEILQVVIADGKGLEVNGFS